jgi:glutamine amidotransferase
MSTVAVIDYGMGNIRSVAKAVEHVGDHVRVVISNDAEQIFAADHVILPGVGALRDCMSELHRLELADAVRECARTRPFLGICLGMQALLDYSEENGGTEGLAIIPGQVRHFAQRGELGQSLGLKIPHMGWNQVHQLKPHPLWQGIEQDSRFYFVHSYYVAPAHEPMVLATTDYGQPFASVIGRDNIFAVQFHPEKSQNAGLQLLKNFIAWDG